MPAFQQPSSYTAGRAVTLLGTAYAPGDTVPLATVKACKDLSALVSKRILVPDVDPWQRRTPVDTPTPTDFPASVRDEMP